MSEAKVFGVEFSGGGEYIANLSNVRRELLVSRVRVQLPRIQDHQGRDEEERGVDVVGVRRRDHAQSGGVQGLQKVREDRGGRRTAERLRLDKQLQNWKGRVDGGWWGRRHVATLQCRDAGEGRGDLRRSEVERREGARDVAPCNLVVAIPGVEVVVRTRGKGTHKVSEDPRVRVTCAGGAAGDRLRRGEGVMREEKRLEIGVGIIRGGSVVTTVPRESYGQRT